MTIAWEPKLDIQHAKIACTILYQISANDKIISSVVPQNLQADKNKTAISKVDKKLRQI